MVESESYAMKLFKVVGMEKFAWALRRLHCPVSANALVLDVGSGGNPYPRANVLLDAYQNTRERHWVPLVTDRPTILGFVENLPFRDKSFDFVVASHVLEHSKYPDKFLSELQRVSKAGYIEVPDAFMERINPYRDHCLEVTVRARKLIIRKKASSVIDEELVELYSDRAKSLIAGKLIPTHPFAFHTRYYWSDNIDYEILNPSTNFVAEFSSEQYIIHHGFLKFVKGYVLKLVRFAFSQRLRNRSIDILSLLRCTHCHSTYLMHAESEIICQKCHTRFEMLNGIPVMYSKENNS